MQLDRTPTSGRSLTGPQSNQNVWVLPAISRDAEEAVMSAGKGHAVHTSICK